MTGRNRTSSRRGAMPASRNARPALRAIAVATAVALIAASQPVFAQNAPPGLPIIRDAEIEQLLRDYTAPILRAAGLGQQNVQVVLINARAFNAFVMDGRRIFVNVGALYDSKTPNEIIGVLAHETGHIAGGHLSRLREQLATAQTASIIALLLGAGAIAAGAATRQQQPRPGRRGRDAGAAGDDPPLAAVISARAGRSRPTAPAIKFLNATGQSAKGMHTTFKRFADDIMMVSSRSRSLPAVASDAARTRRRARRAGQDQSVLGKARSARAAAAPRHDARQARRLPGAAGFDRAALSGERHQPARALCACDRGAPLRRPCQRDRADRRADPGAAEQSLFPRTQGPEPARGRTARRRDRAAAPRRRARPECDADPHHARPGAGCDRRSALRRRGDRAAARRDAARTGCTGRLLPAGHGLRPQGQLRRGRSRLGAGGARPRRHQDRARACGARQDAFPDRVPRLGQVRRHRRPQAIRHPGGPRTNFTVRPGAEIKPILPRGPTK